MRASSDPVTHRAIWNAWEEYDVTSLLPSISMPTLVVHNKNSRLVPVEVGRRTAGTIPGARFAPIDDPIYSTVPGLIERFVQETSTTAATPDLPSGTAVILFADIAGSTALTERLGDAAFRAKARDLDASLRKLIREQSGTCVDAKTLGDGVLATFSSAAKAIEAALACRRVGDEAGLPLHLGLHAGDVIREENNVFGGTVNIAARISGLSAAGEVLVSDTLRGLARTSAGVSFEDRGEQSLKGVGDPVRVYAVSGQE
jgi:class 3 adenylate cyclase